MFGTDQNLAVRVSQHFDNMRSWIGIHSGAVLTGLDNVTDEARSGAELRLAKIVNDMHKLIAYLEKKGKDSQ